MLLGAAVSWGLAGVQHLEMGAVPCGTSAQWPGGCRSSEVARDTLERTGQGCGMVLRDIGVIQGCREPSFPHETALGHVIKSSPP